MVRHSVAPITSPCMDSKYEHNTSLSRKYFRSCKATFPPGLGAGVDENTERVTVFKNRWTQYEWKLSYCFGPGIDSHFSINDRGCLFGAVLARVGWGGFKSDQFWECHFIVMFMDYVGNVHPTRAVYLPKTRGVTESCLPSSRHLGSILLYYSKVRS